jgi:hypothetical protein
MKNKILDTFKIFNRGTVKQPPIIGTYGRTEGIIKGKKSGQ